MIKTKSNFIAVASYIFLIIGIMHITRLLYGWEVNIANYSVPMWIYWAEAFASLYLAFLGFQINRR